MGTIRANDHLRTGGRAVVVGMTALVLGLLPAVPSSTASPADATLGPLISGTSSWIDGTYVWTDYAYDDHGADADGMLGGNADYPDDMAPINVADLIQLQISRVDDEALRVTAVLQTLTPDTRPLMGVAFDSDDEPSTGETSLPGSWTPASPLGMDHLFVLGVDGGQVLRGDGSGWQETGVFDVEVDTIRNTLSADVPFELPAAGTLRSVAALGYEHDGQSWLTGDAPVHDLAFVDDGWVTTNFLAGVALDASGFITGDSAYWQDDLQARILAGGEDPAPAVASIDVTSLRDRRTELTAPQGHGFTTFLYRSSLDVGEGITGSGNSARYDGPYQPYLVWLPEDLRPGLPLVVYLHGASQNHLSPINTAHYDPGSQVPLLGPIVGLPDAIFDFDAVVVWPLGRGPQQWYRDASEQDVLDVTDDVLARLALDPDRVMLAGLSMGGFGTLRLGQLYPDRWSMAYSDVGGDQVNLLENLTNVPLRLHNGLLDPLINVQAAQEVADRAEAAGSVDFRSWILLRGTHQPAVALAECLYLESFERPRVIDPPRVRYTIDPSMFVDDPDTGLRLVYDGAYWVSGMQAAGDSRASVDLSTLAFGTELVPGSAYSSVEENLSAGQDFCGSNPDITAPHGWIEQGRDVVMEQRPVEAHLSGTLTGLAAVTIDVDRAGLSAHDTATLALSTDEATSLHLTGLSDGTEVVTGQVIVLADAGTATVSLPIGDHHIVLRPTAAPTEPVLSPLPATGGGAAWAVLLLLLLATVRRSRPGR